MYACEDFDKKYDDPSRGLDVFLRAYHGSRKHVWRHQTSSAIWAGLVPNGSIAAIAREPDLAEGGC